MNTVDQMITEGRKVIGLAHSAHDIDKNKVTIADLNKVVKTLRSDNARLMSFCQEQTDLIKKYNMAHTGKETPPLVPENKPDTVATEKYVMPSVKLESGMITLGQYDPVYNLFVRNPINKQMILLNGLPDSRQRHYLGNKLKGMFSSIKEAQHKGSFRTIRNFSDETTTGKYLTCGIVYSGNCGCEKRENKKTEPVDLLAELEDDSLQDDLSDYLDSLTETAETETLKGIPLWTASHNPALGSKVQWIIAKRARALMVQNSVKHGGFTKMNYSDVTKIALTSGKIAKSDLMK